MVPKWLSFCADSITQPWKDEKSEIEICYEKGM